MKYLENSNYNLTILIMHYIILNNNFIRLSRVVEGLAL